MKEEFTLLQDLKSKLEALEKASKGEVDVWADLPSHITDQVNETDGCVLPLRLGPYDLDESKNNILMNKYPDQTHIKTPFRLRLYPEDCERLYRSESIRVKRFLPPPEISEALELNHKGEDQDGFKWMVYPLYQNGGIMGQDILISRESVYT